MSTQITITGNIGNDPELRSTNSGKQLLELSVNGTRRAKDRNTNDWADDGGQLWVRATFWERDAEELVGVVRKGDKVTISGDLVVEEYQKKDGTLGQQLLIRFPRFKGVIPRKQGISQGGSDAFSRQVPTGGSQGDPWASQNGAQGLPETAPF